MIVNLLVDVTYGLINPRIRHTPMTAEVLEAPIVARADRATAASACANSGAISAPITARWPASS